MKNRLLYIFFAVAVLFSACEEKTTEELSVTSPVPIFELIGDEIILVQLGDSYTDPGATAVQIFNGDTTEVETINVFSSVNTELAGTYTINYSAENSLGHEFHAPITRKVVVFDDEITGVYGSHVVRDGRVMDMEGTILIVKIGEDGDQQLFSHSDWIGGWYDQYYGYGSRYAFAGVLGINADNTIVHKSSSDPWGYAGSLSADPTPVFDPVNGTISYIYEWTAGYNFDVVLTKK